MRVGVSIAPGVVHAVGVKRGRIAWAAQAEFAGLSDLTEVLARMASEGPMRGRRARVVLTRPLVQFRTMVPGPPVRRRQASRYVALQADRLFRRNGAALVTDARRVHVRGTSGLLAVAASEALTNIVLEGCRQAGVDVEAIGPASDLIWRVVRKSRGPAEIAIPHRDAVETLSLDGHALVRSRLARHSAAEQPPFAATLDGLGPEAPAYASAVAATREVSTLSLFPPQARLARHRAARGRSAAIWALALIVWLMAGLVAGVRTAERAHSLRSELVRDQAAVDSALAVRGQLTAIRGALATLDTAWNQRSQALRTIARLTQTLDEGTAVVALRLAGDSVLRLAAFSGSASRTLAQLEQVPMLADVRLESVPSREVVGTGSLRREVDRVALIIRFREGS